jgi:putative heme-binding domain-containing protein
MDLRAEVGGGQWGITFDDFGRKFFTSNSRHLVQLMYDRRAKAGPLPLPPPAVDIPVDGPQAEVFRQSPVEPWRVIRTQWRVSGAVKGPIEGGGRASGYFSGAAGGTIYRGDAYPPEFRGDAFVADCGSNLIHRKKLTGEIQLSAARAPGEEKSEFLASRDNWFRPVSFANAPDGCLWFCDMYRETIEHPWSLPEPLKSHLDLNAGSDRGRIWRIVPDGFTPRPAPQLSKAKSAEIVALLGHPNGWHRDTAARLLHERHDASVLADLANLVRESRSAAGRRTALRVLAGYGVLQEVVIADAVKDSDATVRAEAIRSALLATKGKSQTPRAQAALVDLAADPSAVVRYELVWSLAALEGPARMDALKRLAATAGDSAWMRAAILASADDAAGELFASTAAANPSFARELALTIGVRNQDAEVEAVLKHALSTPAPAEWLRPLAEGLARGGSSLAAGSRGTSLLPLVAAARERIQAGQGDLAADLTLLGIARTPDAAQIVGKALTSGLAPRSCAAALDALRSLDPPDLGAVLTAAWPKIPAECRPAALRLWRSRPQHHASLLDAVANGAVAKSDLAAEDVAALRSAKDPAVKTRATQLLGELVSRAEAMANYRPALKMKGDAGKGHATFTARCAVCHRFRGEGTSVGPELDASTAAGPEKLLGNILEPSREITAGFQMASVETKSGELIAGIVAAETDGAITLKLAGGELRNIALVDVARIDRSARSLMPEGIETGLSRQDMADLLAYLTSR